MRRTFWLIASGVGLLVICGLYWFGRQDDGIDEKRLLARSRASLRTGQPAKALETAVRILDARPDDVDALLVAGEAAAQLRDFPLALRYYGAIPAEDSPAGLSAAFGRGEIKFHLGWLSESEAELRWVLHRDPDHLLSHFRLAILLGITGRRWEAIPHQMKLLRSGNSSVADLTLLSDPNRSLDQREFLRKCLDEAPGSALPRLGLAAIAQAENQTSVAESHLREVLRAAPELMEAQARLGGLLVLQNADEFRTWHRRLPAEADLHPGIWKARGAWAQANQNPQSAARCFFEGVTIAPNDRFLNYQLGLTLQTLGRSEDASVYLSRYELLQQLAVVADGLHHSPDDSAGMQKAMILTERLGRIWETWAWAQAAVSQRRNQQWAISTLERVTPMITQAPPDVVPELHPTALADLTDLSLPDWVASKDSSPRIPNSDVDATAAAQPSKSAESFELPDLAVSAGVRFRYDNAASARTGSGARIIETTGGGVAAWDYDGDLLPDLYFTQGGSWPVVTDSTSVHDCLYRNRGDGTLPDTSLLAGLHSTGFGQGVATGDVNSDGFPDLYVACIGRNHLYLNEGDGTFREMSISTLAESPVWTTSCLMADLNGDGLPDLYDVNYCRDEAGFSTVCGDEAQPRTCSPLTFLSEADRLLVNLGTGEFSDSSRTSGIALPNGYGLGIVAGELTGDGQLDLFIANDQVSNFLFVNQTESPGATPRFDEQGLQRGLAADGHGQRQGSMGIAAGDVDDDEHLDFLVTNFYFESNTLYVRDTAGFYADRTRQADLRDSGFAMLGFGTQFLDIDQDGRQELVVANGHVDNLTAQGQAYHMPPLLYRRTGTGRFSSVTHWEAGSFFSKQYLGRGLARWDWNADGREEFVVSNIGAEASLVANLTKTGSHYLAVRLVGTDSCRDAIGAVVRVATPQHQIIRHLTAGDGFQSSNERRLIFGLGPETVIDELHIRWPSGTEETVTDIPIDADVRLVEHRGAAELPRVDFTIPWHN